MPFEVTVAELRDAVQAALSRSGRRFAHGVRVFNSLERREDHAPVSWAYVAEKIGMETATLETAYPDWVGLLDRARQREIELWPPTDGALDDDTAEWFFAFIDALDSSETGVVACYWLGNEPGGLPQSSVVTAVGEDYLAVVGDLDDVKRYHSGHLLGELRPGIFPEFMWALDGSWASVLDKDTPWCDVGYDGRIVNAVEAPPGGVVDLAHGVRRLDLS